MFGQLNMMYDLRSAIFQCRSWTDSLKHAFKSFKLETVLVLISFANFHKLYFDHNSAFFPPSSLKHSRPSPQARKL